MDVVCLRADTEMDQTDTKEMMLKGLFFKAEGGGMQK